MAPTDPRYLALQKASAEYADGWVPENPARATARRRAHEIACPVVTPGAGAVLRVLARALDARAVVEVGTGAGVSMLWLLEGMHPDGVITSVDFEAEHQVIAREAAVAEDVNPNRYRLINGRIDEVLERLTEGGYDIALVSSKVTDIDKHLTAARNLLRPGGLLIIDQALWQDRVADPSQRDADTVAMREAHQRVQDTDGLTGALLPVGGGLLVAVTH